jgi:hypothetical protein
MVRRGRNELSFGSSRRGIRLPGTRGQKEVGSTWPDAIFIIRELVQLWPDSTVIKLIETAAFEVARTK